MKEETKQEIKKNVVTGASTVAGATAGVVIGSVIAPETAEAQDVPVSEEAPQPGRTSKPHGHNQSEAGKPETQASNTTNSGANTGAHVEQPEPPIQKPPVQDPPATDNEIEVIGYDRITNDDGSQMDIAVVNVNGNEVGIIDFDLNGEADAMVCDINMNGVLEEGEIENIQGEGIAMEPFQDAAGFNPQFAQNDLPDYLNDADVDTYMA